MSFEFEQCETLVADRTSEVIDPADMINGDGGSTIAKQVAEDVVEAFDELSEALESGESNEKTIAFADDVDIEEPIEITLSEELEEQYQVALVIWESNRLTAMIDHDEELEKIKASQNSAAIEMSQAEAEYKLCKATHKKILEELVFKTQVGPVFPEKPTRKGILEKSIADLGSEDGSSTPPDNREPNLDETWRLIPTETILEGIDRLGAKKRELIIDNFPTLGDLQDARVEASKEFVHFAKKLPKGCGEGLADQITERLLDEVAKA